jgi:uncharacterized protein (UPF0216 family)
VNDGYEMIDTNSAAQELGITANHLRQMVFKKKITIAGKKGRKSLFRRGDVESLKQLRTEDTFKTAESPIAVSQADHPIDE